MNLTFFLSITNIYYISLESQYKFPYKASTIFLYNRMLLQLEAQKNWRPKPKALVAHHLDWACRHPSSCYDGTRCVPLTTNIWVGIVTVFPSPTVTPVTRAYFAPFWFFLRKLEKMFPFASISYFFVFLLLFTS